MDRNQLKEKGNSQNKQAALSEKTAHFHLPGLFEFYDLYKVFLPLYKNHREYFYSWCDIASIYGSPADCLWGGGRTGFGNAAAKEVLELAAEYGISARLTFSNSLLKEEHLSDKNCNRLCELLSSYNTDKVKNGIIIYSDLLLEYIKKHWPDLYFISSTTKVLTDFELFKNELNRSEFSYVVPDFRLNRDLKEFQTLKPEEKQKVEFLCNECCYIGCKERKACYENVSRKNLGENSPDHICNSPLKNKTYRFSEAMKNPAFIGTKDIQEIYLPMGFSNFKIEGRSLGSAIILEFLLYYLIKSEYQLVVREEIYLDSSLDLF